MAWENVFGQCKVLRKGKDGEKQKFENVSSIEKLKLQAKYQMNRKKTYKIRDEQLI